MNNVSSWIMSIWGPKVWESLIWTCSLVIIIVAIIYWVVDVVEDGKVIYYHESMLLYWCVLIWQFPLSCLSDLQSKSALLIKACTFVNIDKTGERRIWLEFWQQCQRGILLDYGVVIIVKVIDDLICYPLDVTIAIYNTLSHNAKGEQVFQCWMIILIEVLQCTSNEVLSIFC